jgi:sodium-independent sulfate anion transporter 11
LHETECSDAGFLVEFVSVPVVAGFTSASAIIIASSQVKGLFGLSYSSEGFVDSWTKLFQSIGSTRLWDTVLGVCCIITLLCLRVRGPNIGSDVCGYSLQVN